MENRYKACLWVCVLLVSLLGIATFSFAEPPDSVLVNGKRHVLTGTEKSFIRAVESGVEFDAGGSEIRPGVLRWLCADRDGRELITAAGIRIVGGKFSLVDLGYLEIPFSLFFRNCDIDLMKAEFSTIRHLTMVETKADVFDATGARFESNLRLKRLQTQVLDLEDVVVEGSLSLSGIGRPGDKSHVSMSRIQVRGKVDIDGAHIGIGLNMLGASIGDYLNLQGSLIGYDGGSPDRYAVLADYCRIGSMIYLRDGFDCNGGVSLLGAKIGGAVNGIGGQINGRGSIGLNLDNAEVGGSVFLRERVLEAMGGGQERSRFRLAGELDLNSAIINGTVDCEGGLFSNPGGLSVDCNFARIAGSVFLRNGFESVGAVNLRGAVVGGDIECQGSTFKGADTVFDGSGLSVAGYLYAPSSVFMGKMGLLGAKVGKSLNLGGARVVNPGGTAVEANGIRIGQYGLLRDGFYAEGKVDFAASVIDRHLAISRTSLPPECILDLSSATVGEFRDDVDSWPAEGNLLISGFSYGQFDPRSPIDAETRIAWLGRMAKFHPQPYEQVAKVLRESGREGDAKLVLMKKSEVEASLIQGFNLPYAWSLIKKHTLGYGHEPWRAGFWLAGLWVFGALVFAVGYAKRFFIPDSMDEDQAAWGEGHFAKHAFNPLVYSLDLCVPVISLRQASGWHPSLYQDGPAWGFKKAGSLGSVPLSRGVLRLYYWIHIILGWVLATLCVFGLAGLIRS